MADQGTGGLTVPDTVGAGTVVQVDTTVFGGPYPPAEPGCQPCKDATCGVALSERVEHLDRTPARETAEHGADRNPGSGLGWLRLGPVTRVHTSDGATTDVGGKGICLALAALR